MPSFYAFKMSIQLLQNYLPTNVLPYLEQWMKGHSIHIRITRERTSKLGDYRKNKDGSHSISVNATLPPELFFFVLTHELAHLWAFENFGRKILPHGKEWKHTYREMLKESIEVYSIDLQEIILDFARSPKANYMATPALVRYFEGESEGVLVFVEGLASGEQFFYKNNLYEVEKTMRKNILCRNLKTGRKYLFNPLAKVEKVE